MSQRLILVGKIGGAFGVRGEVRIATFTGDPMALARYRNFLRKDGSAALTLSSARPSKGGIIARAKEVTSKEDADALRGLELYVPRAALPAPEENEFYLADLIGLAVVTPEGEALGRIKAVPNFGAGDMLEIEPAGGGATWYLPFTEDAVPEVKISERLVVAIRPIEIE